MKYVHMIETPLDGVIMACLFGLIKVRTLKHWTTRQKANAASLVLAASPRVTDVV